MVRIFIIALLFLGALNLSAQKIDAFATARINTNRVVVEQPIKVTVKAYSSTWFSKPLTFQNLQVEGAYVQTFKRTLSSIEYIDKKKYASLEFYYILFPYTTGEIVIPELILTTSIPPENEYKGQEVSLKTKPLKITVNPPPSDADSEHWLVATNASIRNTWSSDLSNLKVGEVVTRTITIDAKGTLPTFIDEPLIGDINFGSIYTSDPLFQDLRDDKSVNGRRVDSYSYLLEEQGEFTLPEVEVTWWNPYIGRLYKRKLPEYTVFVGENPEMHSLQQLKDSLLALNAQSLVQPNLTENDKDWRSYLRSFGIILLGILSLVIVFVVLRALTRTIIKKRKQYLNSELHMFNTMMRQKNKKDLVVAYYQWLDSAKISPNNYSEELEGISNELLKTRENIYASSSTATEQSVKSTKLKLRKFRKVSLRKKIEPNNGNKLKGLNP